MNARLFRWTKKKTSSGVFAGVMVERLSNGIIHAGVVYRTETSGGAYVVHLMGHRKLFHDNPRAGQVFVLANIEAIRLPALAAFARRVYRKNSNQGIPYGFSLPDRNWFDAEGQIIIGPDQYGLTCSHFVLAIFREAGFPLVKLETWPIRPEDKEWQKNVLKFYKWRAVGDRRKLNRLAKVNTEIGNVRCRPVEVGGAALSDQFPCEFAEASQQARKIEPFLVV